MFSSSGLYEVWEVDVLGRPLFCLAARLTLFDVNEEFQRLLDSGRYGGRLQILYPRDRSNG